MTGLKSNFFVNCLIVFVVAGFLYLIGVIAYCIVA